MADPVLDAFLLQTPAAAAAPARRRSSEMTQKTRGEIMRSISERNLAELERLLDLPGSVPNFLSERAGFEQTPLRLAVSEKWLEGVLALLARGASDADPAVSSRWGRKGDSIEPALLLSASSASPQIFSALLAAEKDRDPALTARACASALANSAEKSLSALEILGPAALIARRALDLEQHARALRWDLSREKGKDAPSCAERLLSELIAADPAAAAGHASALWREALSSDAVGVARALAKAGVPLPAGTLELAGSEIVSRLGWRESDLVLPLCVRPKPDPAAQKGGFYGRREPARARVPLSPVAFCAWHNSLRCLAILAGSPSLLSQALSDRDSLRMLSACRSRPALRILKDAGLALESLADPDDGLNPLHREMAGESPSKTSAVEFASLCPQWVAMTDAQGRDPASLCKDAQVVAALEKAYAKKLLAPAPRRSPKAPKKIARRGL